jgi:HEAT repeat protein
MLKLLDDPPAERDARPARSLRRHLARAAREISDPSPERRAFAAYVLAVLGDEQDFELAKGALTDGSKLVREAVVDGMRRPEAIRLLAQVLREDPEVEVRVAATLSLYSIATPGVRPLLMSAAESDPEGRVRERALGMLDMSPPPRPLPSVSRRVARILREDSDHDVRSEAAYVVMIYAGRASVPVLAEAYERETEAWVRHSIVSALAMSKHRSALPILTQALADPSYEVRARAADGLAECGGKAAVRVLADAFAREHNPWVRKSIVTALGTLDTRASRAVLQQALEDPKEIVREAAADVLATSSR